MKACPYCAEEIQDAAVVCRFCNRSLDGSVSVPPAVTAAPPAAKPNLGVAALLSLVIPGAGQMYKGQVGVGLALLFFTVIGYTLFIVPGLILHLFAVLGAGSNGSFRSAKSAANRDPRAFVECPSCHAKVQAWRRRCHSCGADVSQQPELSTENRA